MKEERVNIYHPLLRSMPWIFGVTSIVLASIPHYSKILSFTGMVLAIGGLVIEKKVREKKNKVIILCTIGLIMSFGMLLYNLMTSV